MDPIVAELAKSIPKSRIFTSPAVLASFASDGLASLSARPLAVVIPESEEEAVAAVRVCHRLGVPFVPRGSGTSLSGGATPVENGIVLALNRLNRIVRIDPVEQIAVVEPGVLNAQVSQAAAPYGLYYAPDPSSAQVCTIGGNVAFNSGGAHCLRHGMTAGHVLGIRAVLPDGELVELGSENLEAVGPDLSGFFVGSEGLFGVALQIVLRLLPVPERFSTVLAAYDSLAKAGEAVAQVVAAGLLPGAMEIMDRLTLTAVEAAVHPHYPEAEAVLIVELEGESNQVEADFGRLEQILAASGASSVMVAADPAQRALIWKGRKAAFSAMGRISPDYLVQDGVVPRGRLGEALAKVAELARQHGFKVANVFHAGDGNLHPLILYDGRVASARERAEVLAGEILQVCLDLGGSVTGEHGIGLEKRDYLPLMYGANEMSLMRQIRRAIDPQEIANRGKVFPVLGGR